MIGLARGQTVVKKFKAANRIGSGVLYLLNSGILFEVKQKGVALEIGYAEIMLVKNAKKDKFEIEWKEAAQTCSTSFYSKDASEIVEKISACQTLAR